MAIQSSAIRVTNLYHYAIAQRKTAHQSSSVSPTLVTATRSIGKPLRIALLFKSYGPYHLARLRALTYDNVVLPVEFSDIDSNYDWAVGEEKRSAGIVSLSHGNNGRGRRSMITKLSHELRRFRPEVVAIPGYSEPLALAALHLCRVHKIPTVIMSDSHAQSGKRDMVREAIKRRLLPLFQAALVAGRPQADYLSQLGFARDKIVTGYDVIDNQHFMSGADLARCTPHAFRSKYKLPARYFFCCSRLILKKNLLFLIDSFGRYTQRAIGVKWDLVIAGDGPERVELERRASQLGLTSRVHFLGRKNYDELPALYGLADALVFPSATDEWGLVVNEAMAAGLPVLVSTGAGCHKDLVQDGLNGYVFDPAVAGQLEALLARIATASDRRTMGQTSRRIISEWGLDRFVSGLITAGTVARTDLTRQRTTLGSAIAAVLSYRL